MKATELMDILGSLVAQYGDLVVKDRDYGDITDVNYDDVNREYKIDNE